MNKFDESVLCIESKKLFKKGKWQGLKTKNLSYYYNLLINQSEFRRRGDLEVDSSYKQIIPQVILRYKRTYFLHYQGKVADTRLHNMHLLPLGGHVEKFDLKGDKDVIQTALERELEEEVLIRSKIVEKKFIGLIYLEDDNPINQYHVGLAYIFDLDGTEVEMNEQELTKVGFVGFGYLNLKRETLTYWSNVLVSSGKLQ